MRPQFITLNAIDDLLIAFDEAKEHYIQGDRDWFERRLNEKHGLRDSRFEFDDLNLSQGAGLATDDEYSTTDLENVLTIYTVMRDLPQAVASDQRFWSGLSHTICWDYIRYRRRADIASGLDNPIKISYFFTNGVKRSAHVHCVARMWWAGWLTFDTDNPHNPFALTEVLCHRAFASTIMLLSSSNFTESRNVRLGIFDAVKDVYDSGEEVKRKHWVGACKYLNKMGQMTVLDLLDRKTVKSIVSSYFETDHFSKLVLK